MHRPLPIEFTEAADPAARMQRTPCSCGWRGHFYSATSSGWNASGAAYSAHVEDALGPHCQICGGPATIYEAPFGPELALVMCAPCAAARDETDRGTR
jgi:hypothetical protein